MYIYIYIYTYFYLSVSLSIYIYIQSYNINICFPFLLHYYCLYYVFAFYIGFKTQCIHNMNLFQVGPHGSFIHVLFYASQFYSLSWFMGYVELLRANFTLSNTFNFRGVQMFKMLSRLWEERPTTTPSTPHLQIQTMSF